MTTGQPDKTALVLAAGGVFGAYQAGVWKALAGSFQPDLVVGASIGSINGWLIAGGCSPEELEQLWLDAGRFRRPPLRLARHWWQGWFDHSALHADISGLFARFQPETQYAVVVTDMKRGRPKTFTGAEVTFQHLQASCAVPLAFDLQRIDGRWYGDGGLMGPLPLWAAVELGATRIVAVHPLPEIPAPFRWAAAAGRAISRFRPDVPQSVEVIQLIPEPPLGSFSQLLSYRPERIREWIAAGERDALRIRHTFAPLATRNTERGAP